MHAAISGKPELHDYGGPFVLGKHGQPLVMQPGARSLFWEAYWQWERQGRQVDDQRRCIFNWETALVQITQQVSRPATPTTPRARAKPTAKVTIRSIPQDYGGAFADQAIGNIMTEGLFPIALRQDPRYFVKGTGGFWKRTGYAISREVITRGDDGRSRFNTSELAGNAAAAGISNVYYPAADRSFGNTANKWGQQIGLDTFFNVAKEFWPDVRNKLFGR